MNKGVVREAVDHKTAGKISSALLQQTTPIPSILPEEIYPVSHPSLCLNAVDLYAWRGRSLSIMAGYRYRYIISAECDSVALRTHSQVSLFSVSRFH